jgi:uncharacterized protein (TIGR03663 family)
MSTQDPNATYGTTAERLRAFASNTEARERFSALATKYWERAAFALLAVTAGALRFWNLGARAMHHDESLHAYYGYGFTKGLLEFVSLGVYNPELSGPGAEYHHVPFMHGPFQFIGGGTFMAVFGDGEYQARMLAATLGTAMVVLPFLLRKQLGTIGALAVAMFIAFSPTLMYYSRFTREDIYAAFWTLGIVVFMWRYLASQENKFLYLTAGFLAGSFATKETTFFTAGAFLVFLDYMLAVNFADQMRAKRAMTQQDYVVWVLIFLVIAPAIAIAWPFNVDWRTKRGLEELPAPGNMLIVMGTLALPMFAAAVQLAPRIFDDAWRNRADEATNLHIASAEKGVAYTTIVTLLAISAAIGLTWRPRTWLFAAAAFWVPFFLLFTTFFTNMEGFFSGVWGSMDYWISQQDVRRGNQPDYYYFITIPVYEFLPLILSLAAGAYYMIRGRASHAMIVAGGLALILVCLALPSEPDFEQISFFHFWVPFGIVLLGVMLFPMDVFTRFLLFWTVLSGLAFTVAGEKMPWLNVHIALPLAILAGRFTGEMLEGTDLRLDLPKLERMAPFIYAAVASALATLIFVMAGPGELQSVGAWILVIVAAVAVYWAFQSYSPMTALQVALFGFVAALSVFTLRAGVLSSHGHRGGIPDALASYTTVTNTDYGDVPVELLVYTQTSQDIPRLKELIDQYARETGAGENQPVAIDLTDGYGWPWSWYMRHYKQVQWFSDAATLQPKEGSVVLAADKNVQGLKLQGEYNEGIPYYHRRWFPEDYRGIGGKYTTGDFFEDVRDPDSLATWLDYWVRRTPPSRLGHVGGVAFFPKNFTAAPTQPVGPTVRDDGNQKVIGGAGSAPGQLRQPSDVALDAAGNIYVADTENNRITKYSPAGEFLAVAGGFAAEVGLTQPWSLTVAPDGTVFVADTWAHELVKLDKDLKQIKVWGSGGGIQPTDDPATFDPLKLFGPREIVLNTEGNLLVVDTGNGRIIEFSQDGDARRQFGKKGETGEPLDFSEPVGLAVAPDGDVFAADFWNKRIVRYDKDFNFKSEIAVPAWGSRSVTDRPYLALLPDARLLATDPEHGKILVFGSDGAALGEYALPVDPTTDFARPIGIATDGVKVYVVDSSASVIRVIHLADVVK